MLQKAEAAVEDAWDPSVSRPELPILIKVSACRNCGNAQHDVLRVYRDTSAVYEQYISNAYISVNPPTNPPTHPNSLTHKCRPGGCRRLSRCGQKGAREPAAHRGSADDRAVRTLTSTTSAARVLPSFAVVTDALPYRCTAAAGRPVGPSLAKH